MYAFLPEQATAHIPLENPVKKHLLLAVGAIIFIFAVSFMIGVLIKKKHTKK